MLKVMFIIAMLIAELNGNIFVIYSIKKEKGVISIENMNTVEILKKRLK